MNKYIISAALADSILNYLAKKPFIEVADLIAALRQIEEVKPEKEEKPKK